MINISSIYTVVHFTIKKIDTHLMTILDVINTVSKLTMTGTLADKINFFSLVIRRATISEDLYEF